MVWMGIFPRFASAKLIFSFMVTLSLIYLPFLKGLPLISTAGIPPETIQCRCAAAPAPAALRAAALCLTPELAVLAYYGASVQHWLPLRQPLSGSGRYQPSVSVSFLSIHSASLIMVSSSKGLPRPALSTRLGKSMVPLSLHRRR